MNDFEVFISHSSKDRDIVERVRDYLEKNQILCFDSARDIPPGESYPGVITRSIRAAKVVLLIYTDNSNDSDQVDRELERAMNYKKKLFVLKFSNKPYSDDKEYILSTVEYLDADNFSEEKLFELYQKLCPSLDKEVVKNIQEKKQEDKIILADAIVEASKGNSGAQFYLGKIYFYGWFEVQQNYKYAFDWFKRSFDNGYDDASTYLNWFYQEGVVVPQDKEQAFIYAKISALNGNSLAQINVAIYYFEKGTEICNTEGLKWLSIAANLGDNNAVYMLGKAYLEGKIVEQDTIKAIELLHQAIQMNNDEAMLILANCYKEGNGVKKDINKCIELLEQAKECGNVKALENLSEIYSYKETPELLDYEKAFEYDCLAAMKNSSTGYLYLYYDYLNGWGTEQNNQTAFNALNNAIQLNSAKACRIMAELFETGSEDFNIKQNSEQALFYYKKAAELGDIDSIIKASEYYKKGIGDTQDFKQSFDYALQAALNNDSHSQYVIGKYYRLGQGVEQNDSEAFNWFKKAGEKGLLVALQELGKCYYYGIGTAQNFELAIDCFNKVVQESLSTEYEDGFTDSYFLLGSCYERGIVVEKDWAKALAWYGKAASHGMEIAVDALQRLSLQEEK